MAETCIVCLGDLVPQEEAYPSATETPAVGDSLSLPDGADANAHGARHGSHGSHDSHVPKLSSSAPTPAPIDEQLVAHLLPCGHNLHNECLKPWVERANSCPICRASFNLVELCIRVGGPMISSYAVQDKQQVADIDPSMIVDDEFLLEDDGSYDACMVCDEFGDSSQLMYCHSCEQLCHVFCAGLDKMPGRGPWYCQGCAENPELIAAASQRGAQRSPAAFVNGRSRLPNRRPGGPDEWVGVWQSVWDRLHFDIEFPFEDDDQSENRSEVQRPDDSMQRRFALAQQLGAGNRFRAAADNVYTLYRPTPRVRNINPSLHREVPPAPKDPESQEELRAWNQFEKAKEQIAELELPSATGNGTNTRRRKRKSSESVPDERDTEERQEPERKLKRPRTRVVQDNGESSAAAAQRALDRSLDANGAASGGDPAPALSPPSEVKDGADSSGAGFLQSLLKEVEVNRYEKEKEIVAPQPRRVIVERAMSPQNSSPGLSPVYSHGVVTPPPLNLSRSVSPQSGDEAYFPTYSPYSPADSDARHGRRHLAIRPHSPSSPPRSKDSSPSRSSTLSYSTKSELQRMVRAVLRPFYTRKEITSADYTEINRDVSRLLYERVGDAGAEALADRETRERWQKMAADEVDAAVRAHQAPGGAAVPVPGADDSVSTSS